MRAAEQGYWAGSPGLSNRNPCTSETRIGDLSLIMRKSLNQSFPVTE